MCDSSTNGGTQLALPEVSNDSRATWTVEFLAAYVIDQGLGQLRGLPGHDSRHGSSYSVLRLRSKDSEDLGFQLQVSIFIRELVLSLTQ